MEKPKNPIPLFKVYMAPNASKDLEPILNSGYIGQGPKVEEFEKLLKEYFNTDHLVSVNNATSGEHLAFHLIKNPGKKYGSQQYPISWDSKWPGINPGDEVLATSLTCTATNFPILANGFNIKWVDVNPLNANIDLDDLKRKITPKTKAVIFVHWGGYPVDLDIVKEIQQESLDMYGFKPAVIEDCAHAFGSTYKGIPIGNHGNINTFSFQAIKHLTTVDGGCLILPHEDLHRRAKLLRWYGIDRDTNKKDFRCELDIPEWGFKFHMNDINATIGISNFKNALINIEIHKENAAYYNKELANVDGVQLLENKEGFDSAYWIYSMLVDNKPGFMKHMKECNIIVSQVHERNDIHSCVSQYRAMLPNLEKLIPKLISIPVGWWVSKEEREYIVSCIKRGW